MLHLFDHKRWAETIYRIRNLQEKTQQEFGSYYCVEGSCVCNWEKQLHAPSVSVFLAICKDNHLNPMDYLDYVYMEG